MNPRTKTMLLVGGAAAVGVFAIGWFLTNPSGSSSSSGPQNAVDPGAQLAAGPFAAQGTMPDIGNLLSYNQVPGAISAPQATSVDPFSSNYGAVGA
jgi:hypothetical protein